MVLAWPDTTEWPFTSIQPLEFWALVMDFEKHPLTCFSLRIWESSVTSRYVPSRNSLVVVTTLKGYLRLTFNLVIDSPFPSITLTFFFALNFCLTVLILPLCWNFMKFLNENPWETVVVMLPALVMTHPVMCVSCSASTSNDPSSPRNPSCRSIEVSGLWWTTGLAWTTFDSWSNQRCKFAFTSQ